MSKKSIIPYGKQFVVQEDINAVVDVLKSDYLTQGPKIKEFEVNFAQYIGCKYAVAVANGTAALHLSVLAIGLESGDKVITTPITFAASANSVLYCGGDVDFVDIDHETFLMDLDRLEAKLRSAAKGKYSGIIPVDLAGLPINTERLRQLANEFELWVIEDACHAPGGYFIDSNGQQVKCGSNAYTDLTCFSFHPVKHIAAGEGGMITTNDESLYKKLLRLRTHGITKDNMSENHGDWYYEMQELGFNYRLTDIQAALGNSQLKRADEGLAQRRAKAKRYDEAFSQAQNIIAQQKNKSQPSQYNAYHLYVIRVTNRKDLYNHLRQKGIYAQVHYIPVHTLPYYKKRYGEQSFPKAEAYYNECLSLPMYPSMTDDEQDYVINQVLDYTSL